MLARILDISRPLGPATPAWPGDPPFTTTWLTPPEPGQAAVSHIGFSPHLGTHIDAPLHLEPRGIAVGEVDLAACAGACEVVSLPKLDRAIVPGDLPAGWRPAAPRVLFATRSWPRHGELPSSFAGLAANTVDLLAETGVRLVGTDSPSIDTARALGLPAHRRCVARGIVILEGLDLWDVPDGSYVLLALPLRLVTAEASPVRAVLLSPDQHIFEAG